MNDPETDETFVTILRNGFVRYIKGGTPISELTSSEVPSPRDATPQELEPFSMFKVDEDTELTTQRSILRNAMLMDRDSSSNSKFILLTLNLLSVQKKGKISL